MVKFEIPLGTAQLLVDFLHKRRIARQPCDKSHIKMCLDPVHKLMAAEMTVPAEFYYCVRPFLMDVFNDSAQYTEDVQRLVASSRSQ